MINKIKAIIAIFTVALPFSGLLAGSIYYGGTELCTNKTATNCEKQINNQIEKPPCVLGAGYGVKGHSGPYRAGNDECGTCTFSDNSKSDCSDPKYDQKIDE